MIKVESIKPLADSKEIQLSTIEADYYIRITRDYNPLDSIAYSIKKKGVYHLNGKTNFLKRKLKKTELICLKYLQQNFRTIIVGRPDVLQKIIDNDISSSLFGSVINGRYCSNEFGKAILKIFGYDEYYRTKARKGKWFAQMLNLKSCPYCNAQYTLLVIRGRSIKTKFQFDHFFSKKRYPFLSISMYNLIPSCAPCNLSKGGIDTRLSTHFNAYHSNLELLAKFKLVYKPDVAKLSIGDVKKLDLAIIFIHEHLAAKDYVNAHSNIFDITDSYQRHRDIIEGLLYTAIVHNSSFKNDLLKIEGLFKGKEQLYKRYLLGNYSESNEILDRPLVKFTRDIAEQLGLL